LFFGRIANFVNAELWGRPTDAPWGIAFPTEAAQNCGQALSEICARHPSQLYEAALEGIILFIVMTYLIFRRDWFKVPGQIIGVFFIGYGLARVIVEGYRQADLQFISIDNPFGYIIRFNEFGLTMGQTLSLPMVFIGMAIIYIARRRAI
jgi:phosphatidylglycerol:prolipoprotein diacylglycerol transferase